MRDNIVCSLSVPAGRSTRVPDGRMMLTRSRAESAIPLSRTMSSMKRAKANGSGLGMMAGFWRRRGVSQTTTWQDNGEQGIDDGGPVSCSGSADECIGNQQRDHQRRDGECQHTPGEGEWHGGEHAHGEFRHDGQQRLHNENDECEPDARRYNVSISRGHREWSRVTRG